MYGRFSTCAAFSTPLWSLDIRVAHALMRAASTLARNRSNGSSRLSVGDKQLKAKLLGALGERADLLFTISSFVVFGSLFHVLLAMLDQAVEQARQFASHGGDGFGRPQAGSQPAILCTQIALAP